MPNCPAQSTQNGIVNPFAKNIYATNITADHGYFGYLTTSSTVSDSGTFGILCARKSDGTSVCVTSDQVSALLSGSVLGASTQPHAEQERLAGSGVAVLYRVDNLIRC